MQLRGAAPVLLLLLIVMLLLRGRKPLWSVAEQGVPPPRRQIYPQSMLRHPLPSCTPCPACCTPATGVDVPRYKKQSILLNQATAPTWWHSHSNRCLHISRCATSVQQKYWSKQTTTPVGVVESQRFQVTHPYHPLFSQEFDLFVRAQNWREDRVWFYDPDERLRSLPAIWTSIVPEDVFNALAAGRALFRVEELLELCRLISEFKS